MLSAVPTLHFLACCLSSTSRPFSLFPLLCLLLAFCSLCHVVLFLSQPYQRTVLQSARRILDPLILPSCRALNGLLNLHAGCQRCHAAQLSELYHPGPLMLCLNILCLNILCLNILCLNIFCLNILCLNMLCYVMFKYFLSCYVMLCYVMLC